MRKSKIIVARKKSTKYEAADVLKKDINRKRARLRGKRIDILTI